MEYYFKSIANLFFFLLPVLIGLKRFTILDKALKIFFLFALSSFIGELSAFFSANVYKNNLPVYSVFSIINLTIICFYFKEHFQLKRSKNRINFLIGFNLIVWLFTIFYIHSITSVNSTFLGYQGILTMGFSVHLMENIVSRRSREVFDLKTSSHFWIAFLLLVYWCFSIMQWILYSFFSVETMGFWYLELSLIIINMAINFCFALIFIQYPKMIQSNGH
jgi:hypothetical protein